MAAGFELEIDLSPEAEVDDVDTERFKRAVGSFATGVTVVTTAYKDRLHGFTANSFTSVSLRPPLVLVCLDRRAPSMSGFHVGASFAVNILSADQKELSGHFARRADDKFAGIDYRVNGDGVPLLKGCLANIECTLAHWYNGGDHNILVGRAHQVTVGEGEPLLFHRSAYLT